MELEQLASSVANLGAPIQVERSFQISADGLFTQRQLISIDTSLLSDVVHEDLIPFYASLGAPALLLENLASELESAKHLHWGYEEAGTCRRIKAYFEYPLPTGEHHAGADAHRLYRAFKWDAADGGESVQSLYCLQPPRDQQECANWIFGHFDSGEHAQEIRIVQSILDRVVERIPYREMQLLEVTEEGNSRRSFDINLYDAGFCLRDLRNELHAIGKLYSVDSVEFETFLDKIQQDTAGHIAGGIHRDGKSFFNIYFSPRRNLMPQTEFTRATPATSEERFALEYCDESDQFANYCLWPYEPVAPTENKLRSINLLWNSFQSERLKNESMQLVRRIQSGIGAFKTVFGVKRDQTRFAWEFYFYDYKRLERDVSFERLTKIIQSRVPVEVSVDENIPYFMFSIDFDETTLVDSEALSRVHLYLGNPGSTVSSGVSYGITNRSQELENFYFFFDADKQLSDAADKIISSVHIDPQRVSIDDVLRPELRNCRTICIANKRYSDTVYFSGITIEQLQFFLAWQHYPSAIQDFVGRHARQLDHLLYDVGIDYTSDAAGLRVVKSGYYGVF